MVDYSRFQRIVDDLSDSDSDEKTNNKPIVTKLDKPMTISFGKQEVKSKPTIDLSKFIENGAENEKFWWSQTNDEVILRVKCQSTALKSKDIRIELLEQNMLQVVIRNVVVIEGKLSNPVWNEYDSVYGTTEEERFQKSMTWELENIGNESQKCIVIRLFKRSPHDGIKIWWRRMFADDTYNEIDIDVTKISSRSKGKAEEYQKVWQEAHEAFRAARRKEKE